MKRERTGPGQVLAFVGLCVRLLRLASLNLTEEGTDGPAPRNGSTGLLTTVTLALNLNEEGTGTAGDCCPQLPSLNLACEGATGTTGRRQMVQSIAVAVASAFLDGTLRLLVPGNRPPLHAAARLVRSRPSWSTSSASRQPGPSIAVLVGVVLRGSSADPDRHC
uniref:Secreted protein n=1 Tax=Steinernema glaseri TaxID=37863 RepID=A0A1I7Z3I8_9BILA